MYSRVISFRDYVNRLAPGKRDVWIGSFFLIIAIVLPFLDHSRSFLSTVILLFIWASIVTQWNLIFGVAGIFSLAQMAVFCIGGYTAAMLSLYFGWSLWFTSVLGALMAVLVSAIIGAATIRLRGAYVALLTLGVAVVMQVMIMSDSKCFYYEGVTCYNFTGGPRGLSSFGDFGFRDWLGYKVSLLAKYYLALLLLVLGTIFVLFIIRGPFGYAFRALRDSDTNARSQGINRVKYQILVFALSGFFTGLAGAFYAGHYKTIGPTMLDFPVLLLLLAMMVIGGLGRPWGPLFGCILLMVIDDLLKVYAEWRYIGMGAITIFFIILMRQGVVGLIEWMWNRGPEYISETLRHRNQPRTP
jgi:branched-chain amino acid transport system permease protein